MTLNIEVFQTGQLGNNVSVLYDDETRKAVVIDPSFGPEPVLDFILSRHLIVEKILLTHGHFDHTAGVAFLVSRLPDTPKVGMHQDDLELLRDGGGSKNFHMPIVTLDDPDFYFCDKQVLLLDSYTIEVRLAPGHTPGSVIFVVADLNCAICGDLIFYHGVGRTDLAGGSFEALLSSIKNQVFTLPPETRLIPGHGQETTVHEELANNPFIN